MLKKLLSNILKRFITKLNELIYAGVRLVYNKICILMVNSNRNRKRWWEIRLERLIKKLTQQYKVQKKKKTQKYYEVKRQKKNNNIDKSDNTSWRDKAKEIG